MTLTRAFAVILLALLIGAAGVVSAYGQTQDKPKVQTTEVKKAQCTECKDCKGTCTDCKGTCSDCKGNCTECKGKCADCKKHDQACNGQCGNGHEKKAGPSTKKPAKK